MDDLISYLQTSIQDEVFSKNEKRDFKLLLQERKLDAQQINFLRSKIFELANQKINSGNFQFIMEWVRMVINALGQTQPLTVLTSRAYFSPGDACRNAIIKQIDAAIKLLHVCVFTISDDTISSKLLAAHKRGVAIKVITDNDKSMDEGSDIYELSRAGIAVKMDNTSNHMHHKFMIADQHTLITGSYNWTRSAARYNHENILLTQEPEIVKSFAIEFELLWTKMEDFR